MRSSGAYVFPWYRYRSALVATEDVHTQSMLKEALGRAGYAAELCGDARLLLGPQKTVRHSLLVLKDEGAGRDIVRALRKQGTRTPVLLLSGATVDSTQSLDSDIGNVECLSTPFTMVSLQLAIGKVSQNDPPRSEGSPKIS